MNILIKEKGTSWTLLIITNIWLQHLVQGYLENNICYFRSPISPWRGPQSNSLFRTFFINKFYIFTMPKISMDWGPLQPFLNIDHDFGHICFLKKLWNFFGTKSGSYSGQKFIFFSFWVFFYWETSIYFCPLFVHFRTLSDTLTYSAVIVSDLEIASPSFASLFSIVSS